MGSFFFLTLKSSIWKHKKNMSQESSVSKNIRFVLILELEKNQSLNLGARKFYFLKYKEFLWDAFFYFLFFIFFFNFFVIFWIFSVVYLAPFIGTCKRFSYCSSCGQCCVILKWFQFSVKKLIKCFIKF